MTTEKELQAKAERLHTELAQAERDIAAANDQLLQAVGQQKASQEQAEQIAARVMVLEARKKSISAAIQANEREQERRAELLKSKEYKDGLKKIAELEAYFTRAADEVFQESTLLRERVQADIEKHAEYTQLIRSYELDLDRDAKRNKTHNADYRYLAAIHTMLHQRHEIDKTIEGLKKYVQEVKTAKPAKKRAKPIETVSRYKDAILGR